MRVFLSLSRLTTFRLLFAENASGAKTSNDPHFIPLVSQAEAYLPDKEKPPDYMSLPDPQSSSHYGQPQPPTQHGPPEAESYSQSLQFSKNGANPLTQLTNLILGQALSAHAVPETPPASFYSPSPAKGRPPAENLHHYDSHAAEDDSVGAPKRSSIRGSVIENGPPPSFSRSFSPEQESASVPPIEFDPRFKAFEKSLAKKDLYSFSPPVDFPNVHENDKKVVGVLVGGRRREAHHSFPFNPKRNEHLKVDFSPPPPNELITQKKEIIQHNPERQTRPRSFHKFHQPPDHNQPGNSFAHPKNERLPSLQELQKTINYRAPSVENFDKTFQEIDASIARMFGTSSKAGYNSQGINGLPYNQETNTRRVSNNLSPRRGYSNSNNNNNVYAATNNQRFSRNNFQRPQQTYRNDQPPPIPYPSLNNIGSGQNYGSPQSAGFGFGARAQYSRRAVRRKSPLLSKNLRHAKANLDGHTAGIDGVSDMYEWLGSDEPILKQFSEPI